MHMTRLIANDERCTAHVQRGLGMPWRAAAAFNAKNTIFTSKLGLNLRKKLVKCHIWSIALYGAEASTLQ
jgi:hypothetical protein